MFKLSDFTQRTLFIIPIATALLFTQTSTAQVYKYQDGRGVVRYSENPPANVKATKATPSEIVNSLQPKRLCATPQAASEENIKVTERPLAFLAVKSPVNNKKFSLSGLKKRADDLTRATLDAFAQARDP
ncbi:MAG: DUF4124 domain-containing protein, partial [Methylophilaceae bacterium]